jgi:hypothetical protein
MRYVEQVALRGTERRKVHTEFWYETMKIRNRYDSLLNILRAILKQTRKHGA